MKNKNMYRVLILLIIAGTLAAAALILLLPLDFKPDERNEKIKDEVISKIKDIAEQRNSLAVISFTPFMWDEGYYFDKTANESLREGIIKRNIEYKQLLENEQRLLFFYKGQWVGVKISDRMIRYNERKRSLSKCLKVAENMMKNLRNARYA